MHFSSDNNIEIITDIKESYNILSSCFADIPSVTVRFYEDSLLPLYKLYSVEKNLTQALSPKVWLKCGGYVIIEQTEAMSVIDVNSGKNIARSKKQSDKEKAALKVNLEAAKEIMHSISLQMFCLCTIDNMQAPSLSSILLFYQCTLHLLYRPV